MLYIFFLLNTKFPTVEPILSHILNTLLHFISGALFQGSCTLPNKKDASHISMTSVLISTFLLTFLVSKEFHILLTYPFYNSLNLYLPGPNPFTFSIIPACFNAFITFVAFDFEQSNHAITFACPNTWSVPQYSYIILI